MIDMDTKNCYEYNDSTGEYVGTKVLNIGSNGEFELPSNCTFEEPLKKQEFKTNVFREGEWILMPDYRRHFENGEYHGGKPYYFISDLWWAEKHYMTSIGDIPEGASFELMDKPSIVSQYGELIDSISSDKAFLNETDKNYIELEGHKNGYRSYLTPEDVLGLEAIEVERDNRANSIRSNNMVLEELKEQIIKSYGEEALNHVG